MKISSFIPWLAAGAGLALAAGCANLEAVSYGDPHRTVHGTVEFRAEAPLPEDAVVVVRIVDMAGTEQIRSSAGRDLPIGDRAKAEPVPQVLAEQTIKGASSRAVPFQLEFDANDDLLRHGLNIDARISVGGKVRYRTASAHVLTLGNVEYPHAVWVEPTSR
ncbi:MAG: hypothetical protein EBR23_06110 [Planctomycetia bacterium]|nr:hypothetical protein [Planctomycetia bacterium]